MEKKTLNLNFVELEPQPGNTDVCLMPCPCSSSYSYPSTTYQGTGGDPLCVAKDLLTNLIINEGSKIAKGLKAHGEACQAEQAAAGQAAECGYDIDYGGTTNLGPSFGCGGGATPK